MFNVLARVRVREQLRQDRAGSRINFVVESAPTQRDTVWGLGLNYLSPFQHQWHRFEVVIQGGLGLRLKDEGTKIKTQSSLKKIASQEGLR
jgi:hypothetical protein